MANLLVDIGNTVLKAAWADGVTLGKTFRYQGEHMVSFILSLTDRVRPEVLVISSARDMVPSDEDRLKTCCDRLVIMDSMHRDMYRDVPEYLTGNTRVSKHLAPLAPCKPFLPERLCTPAGSTHIEPERIGIFRARLNFPIKE